MAEAQDIIVLKFGSSVIPSEEALRDVVAEILRWLARGFRVVAVVSAIGGATDSLLAHARQYGEVLDSSALAAYVSTGELQAAALLGLALGRAGTPAAVLDAASIGLITEGPPLDAHPVDLDTAVLRSAVHGAPVVIIPGFIGRDGSRALGAGRGATTLLGRGGSDLSAVFIADRLGARCRLIKDVDGLYERDPAVGFTRGDQPPRRYHTITHEDAIALDGGIVQHKAVRYARSHARQFEVTCAGSDEPTIVGAERTEFARLARNRAGLQVAGAV